MAWSLPRSRSAAAISYGYLGRSISNVSSDSASRLLTFRRLAILYHLVSESSVTMTRYQVLVDEYTAADTGRANSLKPLFGRTGSGWPLGGDSLWMAERAVADPPGGDFL